MVLQGVAMPLETGCCLQNRYELHRQLGVNQGRETWLATDTQTQIPVTIKSLYFGRGMQWQDLKLLERSAQTLQSLSHPQIPHVVEVFWWEQLEGNYFCLVQRYIPGNSLAELVEKGLVTKQRQQGNRSAWLRVTPKFHQYFSVDDVAMAAASADLSSGSRDTEIGGSEREEAANDE
jgi:serine/threonine protein kinase